MKKNEYIAALRELADYVEARNFPDTQVGWLGEDDDVFSTPELSFHAYDKKGFGLICAAMGSFEKDLSEWNTGAKKALPLGAKIRLYSNRDIICKKIVVGTRIVAATPEEIIPAKPEHEEFIVEWECPQSFVELGK